MQIFVLMETISNLYLPVNQSKVDKVITFFGNRDSDMVIYSLHAKTFSYFDLFRYDVKCTKKYPARFVCTNEQY